MDTPIMKERRLLTAKDFLEHSVWVRVRDYDQGQSWFSGTTELIYRPWDGDLPFEPKSPFPLVLVNARFQLSNGKSYRGYFNPVRNDWDDPLPSRKMRDGSLSVPLKWSDRRGGTPHSILAIHSPVIFINDASYDFHLRKDLQARARHITEFYRAVGESPEDLFPIHFAADQGLFRGIDSGKIMGFYSFPLDKPWEIDSGKTYL